MRTFKISIYGNTQVRKPLEIKCKGSKLAIKIVKWLHPGVHISMVIRVK